MAMWSRLTPAIGATTLAPPAPEEATMKAIPPNKNTVERFDLELGPPKPI
jgi:hypothetical protein